MLAKRRLLVAVTVVVLLVAARVAAPYGVKSYLNRKLAKMGEYHGSLADVDLNLWRGAYQVDDLVIVKAGSKQKTEFARIPLMDLSVQWKSLLSGEAVGEIVMHDAVFNFVQGPGETETQLGSGVNWAEETRDLFPFRLNRFEVQNGLVTFRAPGIRSADALKMQHVEFVLRNLTNVQDRNSVTFADVSLKSRVMSNAPFRMKGSINPNEKAATFDVDLTLEKAKLVDVNPWLREFLKVDAEAGAFSMYAEMASANGKFKGYVKPILENPEIFRADEPTSGPFQMAWEALVGLVAKILENRKEDQVATRIPLEGRIDNPDAGILETIVNLFRNAFFVAFGRSLEGTITLRNVGRELADKSEERK